MYLRRQPLDTLRTMIRRGLNSPAASSAGRLFDAVAAAAASLAREHRLEQVVLTGGVFQNRLLLERVSHLLREQRLRVLAPAAVPANDGGLSLGQAVVAWSLGS